MGDALGAFDSVWQRARATFGAGTPQTGEQFDKSTQLRGMQTTVQSAAPGDKWSGAASGAYGTANGKQDRALGGLADLDQQLRAAVDRSADIVTKGRQGLDETRKWVRDMAAQVPAGRNRDMQLLPIASNGLKQVTDLLTSTVTQQNAVADDIKALTTRYSAIKDDLPLSPKDDKKDDKDLNKILGFGEEKEDKDKKGDPGKKAELNSANGKADGDVLKDGMHGLFPPGDFHDRLIDASTLTPQQLADLAAGKPVVVGADRMAYLYQLSQSMNGMTPAQIKEMRERLPPDEQRALAQGLAIISNSNAKSGIPNTEGVTDATRDTFVPAAGSLVNLPDGVYHELTRSDRVGTAPGPPIPTGSMFPAPGPDATKLNGVGALQDISDIFKSGDGRYLNGSEAGKAMLEATSTYAAADIAHREATSNPAGPGAPPLISDQHGSSLPSALAGVAQVGGQDHVGMHELVTGSSGDKFLHNFTAEAWGKDSDKVGDAFRWMSGDPHNPMDSETANKVAHFLSDNRHALEHMPGGGSFGSVNGGLLQGMADGTRPYMAQLAGSPIGGLFDSPGIKAFANQQQMSDMFAVFDQDHQAGTTANNAALQQKQFLELYAAEHGVHGNQIEIAQRLANAMTSGAESAQAAHLANHVWEVHEQDQKKAVAFDTTFNSLTGLTSVIPGVGPFGAALESALGPTLKDQLIHETNPNMIQGDNYFTDQLHSGQFNSTSANYATALQGLINAHPEIARDPSLGWALKVDDNGKHVVNLDAIHNAPKTVDHSLTDWFRINGRKYGYDKGEWASQREEGDNGTWN